MRKLGELGDLGKLVGREAQSVEIDFDGAAAEDTQTTGLAQPVSRTETRRS